MEENKIIAIRKKDIKLAHEAFANLMLKTEDILNNDARLNPYMYKSLSSTELEECSVEKIKLACENTPFDANEVKLISGQRFPDIIADKYYGIEVKKTKQDHWKSVGSSIIESTRDKYVEDIYILFGKMGGKFPEFACRPYEDVMYDIAVTHSPRYLIDMELGKGQTIFDKMNIPYHELRSDQNSIDKVRAYYKKRAHENNKMEMPWWVTSENAEEEKPFNVSLWNNLPISEKRRLKAMCMILFPEALNPKGKQNKYYQTTLWLCSYKQVVMPNIRDLYSAGGKITHVNGERLKTELPQIFNQIITFSDTIKEMLENPSSELLMLIKDFNPILLSGENPWIEWVKICSNYANLYNIDLAEYINKKPQFMFSK